MVRRQHYGALEEPLLRRLRAGNSNNGPGNRFSLFSQFAVPRRASACAPHGSAMLFQDKLLVAVDSRQTVIILHDTFVFRLQQTGDPLVVDLPEVTALQHHRAKSPAPITPGLPSASNGSAPPGQLERPQPSTLWRLAYPPLAPAGPASW